MFTAFSKGFWSRALPWVFLFGGFALYAAGTAPGLSILDAGEFLGVASTLGVAHPTGYPLYALLGQLATFFPWGEEAFLINLISAAAAAGAAFFVALAAGELARMLKMGELGTALAVGAAGLLALAGRTLWSVATMAEVYGLNALFWGALLWGALRLRRTGAARELYVLALIAGLSLANHATIVLFFPALIFIGWPGRERAKSLTRALPLAAALFAAGISVNLYTPLRAAQKPVFNWNDPSTARSLYAHLAGFQYRGNFLEEGVAGVKDAWAQYRDAAPSNVTPLAAFAVAGLAWLFARRRWAVAAALLLYYGGYLAYCLVYSIPDIFYYFIPLHLATTFVAALGVGVAAQAAAAKFPKARLVASVGAGALIFAAAGWAFASNFPYAHRRGFIFAEAYGRRLLAELPAKAIFFPSGDTNTFITWYDIYGRRFRPDVVIVDQIRLASRGYLTALARRNPDLKFPDEAEVFLLAERGVARGDYDATGIVFRSSDDFILPEVIADIIAENAGKRRMFWGLGDRSERLRQYFIPYDLALEVVTEEPSPAEVRRRAVSAIKSFAALMGEIERKGRRELRDPFFKRLVAIYYSVLSNHLADRGVIQPQEELLKSYIRLFPDEPDGYQNLASVYMALGAADEAVTYYRRALELAPGSAELRAKLARALFAAGRPDEAAEVAESLAEDENGEGGYVGAVIFREQGNFEKALAAFEAAKPHYEDDGEFWWEFGLTHDAAGDSRAAVAAFDRALELNPYSSRIHTARGVNFLKLGEDEAAAADFERALELNPGEAQAHYNLACLRSRAGRPDEAMRHLALALELNPGRYAAMARDDPDLAACRELPRFRALLEEYAPPATEARR
jgi:uncharacterized protein (TIGR03382 family)